ncbi:hypothetical protein [Marinomonas sp. 2405UD68-3]|uniref:hypothetical protein n=1 Tax=Marinomonas sp. 2405UD68-3 TaxID=3391835 RepID=UPI0039C9702F
MEATEYETLMRPATSFSNAKGTASLSILKRNNIFRGEIKSFEYMISLVSNAEGYRSFSMLLDIEDTLNLAHIINQLRSHISKKIGKSKNITVCTRGSRNLTFQFKDMTQHMPNDPICNAYFNFSKDEKYFLPLSYLTASSIYAKCIEFLSLNHACSPSELHIFYPFLSRE